MAHSKSASLPDKPRPDFPLYAHKSDRWAKKVRGRTEFFGKATTDRQGIAALEEWLRVKDHLLAGRPRPAKDDQRATVEDVADHFLTFKKGLLATGELAPRTFDRYYATGETIVKFFGANTFAADLTPNDFQSLRASMAKRWGPVALANEIQTVRSMFAYALKQEVIDKPARFGAGFEKPSEKVMRATRAAAGDRTFTPDQIKGVLAIARPAMRAMVLLGINGGLGNTDVAELTAKAFDLDAAWLDYPRTKTGIPRRIPLWPETVAAVREAIDKRREPTDKAAADLLFIGARGESYVGGHRGYRVTAEFSRLLKEAGIEGRAFYDLRRTFQTIAEGVADLTAVQAIMGHAPPANDMSARYRQRIDDARLLAVVNHVRAWLYPSKPAGALGTDRAKAATKPRAKSASTTSRKPRVSAELPSNGFQFRVVG